jgi:anti-anti-sigma regulatory factor
MNSEALEIKIEEWNHQIALCLGGRFHSEQIPNIREKINALLLGDNRNLILDLTDVSEMDESVPLFLLEMMNSVRSKQGEIKMICPPASPVMERLEKYKNIFNLYPHRKSLFSGGFIKKLQTRGIILSRKTGIRISRPVAVLLTVAIVGWFLSLLGILLMQGSQIKNQKNELNNLRHWKQKTEERLQVLQERLKPLEDLGVITDTAQTR